MKIKKILLSALVILGFTSFSGIANAACGKISIANMNWASANFMAEVDKVILEKGYGCEVELVPGATMPTFTSMQEKGEPDVAPEFWANAAIVALNKAVDVEYAKDCAMQIAAMNPVAIDKDDVDEAIVAKEIEIAKELLIQEGKPADMVDKIALGKLNKFFKENTLINQAFIKDSKKSVKQYLSEGDADLTVTAFKRYSLS